MGICTALFGRWAAKNTAGATLGARVALVLALILYLLFGGWLFHSLEAEAEAAAAQSYCSSLDLSLKKMAAPQRSAFAKMLNSLVNSNLCRAPSCAVVPLDALAFRWTLLLVEEDDDAPPAYSAANASVLWTAEQQDQLSDTFSAVLGVPTVGVSFSAPAVAVATPQLRQLDDGGGGSGGGSRPVFQASFDVAVQGDTQVSTASAETALLADGFAAAFAAEMAVNTLPHATEASVIIMFSAGGGGTVGATSGRQLVGSSGGGGVPASKITKFKPGGIPTLVLDGDAASYPASLFSNTPASPGATTPGFLKIGGDGKLEGIKKPGIRGELPVAEPLPPQACPGSAAQRRLDQRTAVSAGADGADGADGSQREAPRPASPTAVSHSASGGGGGSSETVTSTTVRKLSGLSCFSGVSASGTVNGCSGAYPTKFHGVTSAAACAAKCVADATCVQFVFEAAGVAQVQPCRLSATCTTPLMKVLGWDGYLRTSTDGACATPADAADHGWIAGADGQSCGAACAALGGTRACYEAQLLANIADVTGARQVKALATSKGGTTITGSCPISSFPSAPNFKTDGRACARVAGGSSANVDCAATPPVGTRRLCYCSPGVTSASACPTGRFYAENRCSACPTGTFKAIAGQGSCAACPGGLFQNETGAAACKPCDRGMFMTQAWMPGASSYSRCRACAVGKFPRDMRGVGGYTACAWCPAGKYQDYWLQNHTRSCTGCPAGRYRKSGKTAKWYFKRPECSACPRGRVASRAGMGKCEHCPDGQVLNKVGATGPCKACPKGKTSVRPHIWCSKVPQEALLRSANADACNTTVNGSTGRRLAVAATGSAATEPAKYVMGQLVADTSSLNWESGSHLFALTCFTTIGYGTFVPATEEGKWAAVWYSFFGFVLFALATGPAVEALARWTLKVGRLAPIGDTAGGLLAIGLSGALNCIWLTLMGKAFIAREGWNLGDAFYWAFITSTSIGFGDMSPDASMQWAPTFLLIPLGLVFMASFFEVVGKVLMPDTKPIFARSRGWGQRVCCPLRERLPLKEAEAAGRPPSALDKCVLLALVWGGLVLLLLVGGAMLGGLERDAERDAATQWWIDFNETFSESTAEPLPGDVHGNASAIKGASELLMAQLERMGTCDFPSQTASNWDLSPATIYLFTALSTVGYGSFSVATDAGRRFVVLFASLFLWVFAAALQMLSDCLTPLLEGAAVRLGPQAMILFKDTTRIKGARQDFLQLCYFLVVFAGMVGFLALAAAVFLAWDPALDMEFANGFWFVFASSSTIGFGDTTPDFTSSGPAFLELVVITAGFVVVGVGIDACTHLCTDEGRAELWARLSGKDGTGESDADAEAAAPPPAALNNAIAAKDGAIKSRKVIV